MHAPLALSPETRDASADASAEHSFRGRADATGPGVVDHVRVGTAGERDKRPELRIDRERRGGPVHAEQQRNDRFVMRASGDDEIVLIEHRGGDLDRGCAADEMCKGEASDLSRAAG